MPLRIVFMGTPEFAVPTLLGIIGSGHEVVGVYTRAPKPAGRRGLHVVPSPVEREARRFGLPVLSPATLRSAEAQGRMRAHGADAAVVVAYGVMLPKAVLDSAPLGAFNLHASLLPRWRGAAPIQRAIMAGDTETGVMVMKMDEGLDTGQIALGERISIEPDATAGDLHNRLARAGANLMLRALGAIERGSLTLTSQRQDAICYARKIEKEETRIVWTWNWHQVHNQIRGLSPAPGAWFEPEGQGPPLRVKVMRSTRGGGSGAPGTVLDNNLTVACGEGAVRILEVQRAGREPMSTSEFLRGTPIPPGLRLS